MQTKNLLQLTEDIDKTSKALSTVNQNFQNQQTINQEMYRIVESLREAVSALDRRVGILEKRAEMDSLSRTKKH